MTEQVDSQVHAVGCGGRLGRVKGHPSGEPGVPGTLDATCEADPDVVLFAVYGHRDQTGSGWKSARMRSARSSGGMSVTASWRPTWYTDWSERYQG